MRRSSDALERELQDRHGLTVSEFEVLQRLAETQQQHSRMQDLADSVHLSQSALSRLIGRLETDGFVTRALCTEDRRGIFACLTAAGRELRRGSRADAGQRARSDASARPLARNRSRSSAAGYAPADGPTSSVRNSWLSSGRGIS